MQIKTYLGYVLVQINLRENVTQIFLTIFRKSFASPRFGEKTWNFRNPRNLTFWVWQKIIQVRSNLPQIACKMTHFLAFCYKCSLCHKGKWVQSKAQGSLFCMLSRSWAVHQYHSLNLQSFSSLSLYSNDMTPNSRNLKKTPIFMPLLTKIS